MAFLRRASIGLVAISLLLGAVAPRAAAAQLNLYEQEIKAGLLYNFLKYTEWPRDQVAGAAPVTLCLFGGDPFGGYLSNTQGRTVNQHPIVLRNIGSVGEAASCNLLVVDGSEKSRWPELSRFLAGKGVLTVADYEGFTNAGGMIEFGRKGDHISVTLNVDAVRASRLLVQERLLRLVTVVHAGKGGEAP